MVLGPNLTYFGPRIQELVGFRKQKSICSPLRMNQDLFSQSSLELVFWASGIIERGTVARGSSKI